MSETVRVNVRVSPEVYQWYKDRAEKTGVSMSSLMFLAVEKDMIEKMFMGTNLPALIDAAQKHGVKPGADEQRFAEAILNASKGNLPPQQ